MFCINTTINKSVNNKSVDGKNVNEIVDENKENKEIINIKKFSNKFLDNLFFTSLQQIIPIPIGDGESEIDKTKGKSLEKLFKKAYENNNIVKNLIDVKAHGFWKLPTALTKKGIRLSMEDLKIENKQLYMKNRMYVLENKPLQLFLLQQYHNPPIHDHSEYKTMY